ncbi:type II toxin-antitoxin system RelE/ParE family toxin [Candidatus Nomurabacteria bacterium]|nr:type II toxin-antitoxin system RelE/ParE family toxin [Candidatus Nomurabacteria bacterium]
MKNIYFILFLDEVKEFTEKLSDADQGKINAAAMAMEAGDFESIYIKTLKAPIKELIIKKYRFIFFIHKNTIYFIRAFIKKTAKTPKNEINNAQKVCKIILANNK